jgi:hypothetical protein
MEELVDLGQQESLPVGEGDRTIVLSEASYNLICSILNVLDEQDRWGISGEDLPDAYWQDAIQLVSIALWEMG